MQTNKHDSCDLYNYSKFVDKVKTSQLYQDPDKTNIDNLLNPMLCFLQVYFLYQFNIPFITQHIESRNIEDIVCNPGQIADLIDFKSKDVIKSIVFDKYLDKAAFLKSQLLKFVSLLLKLVGCSLIVYNIIPESTSFITEALKIIAALLSSVFTHDHILAKISMGFSKNNILFLLSVIILGAQFKISNSDFIKYTLISALTLNPLHVQEEIFNFLYTLGVCNIPINSFILMAIKAHVKDLQTQHDNTQNDRPFSLQFFDKCHESGEFDDFLETRSDYLLK